MAVPRTFRRNFETLRPAAPEGNLALLECTCAQTGGRYVICAVGHDEKGFVLTPFGNLHDGNPFEAYIPPAS
jgi:hypothetical protein